MAELARLLAEEGWGVRTWQQCMADGSRRWLCDITTRVAADFCGIAVADWYASEDGNALILPALSAGVRFRPLEPLLYLLPPVQHRALMYLDLIRDVDPFGNIREADDPISASEERWTLTIAELTDVAAVARTVADLVVGRAGPLTTSLADVGKLSIVFDTEDDSVDWTVPVLLAAAGDRRAAADALRRFVTSGRVPPGGHQAIVGLDRWLTTP